MKRDAEKKDRDKRIGLRIRERREALGYSREQLAEQAEMSPTFLADIELGTKGFTETTLIKLCRNLAVSADYILFGQVEKPELHAVCALLSGLKPKYLPHVLSLLTVYVKGLLATEED